MNNVVIVSGGQPRDSAIHVHGCVLPQTPPPSRLHVRLSRDPHAQQQVLAASSL